MPTILLASAAIVAMLFSFNASASDEDVRVFKAAFGLKAREKGWNSVVTGERAQEIFDSYSHDAIFQRQVQCQLYGCPPSERGWREVANVDEEKWYLMFPLPKYLDEPVQASILLSFKSPQKKPYGKTWRAMVALVDFDCRGHNLVKKEIKVFHRLSDIEPMRVFPLNDVTAVKSGEGSVSEKIFNLVCS